MSLWKRPVTLGAGLPTPANTMGAFLGLTITEVGPDYLRGTLPVDHRTVQPYGRLHGGASCVLAEELGSVAAYLATAPEDGMPVGLDINANHIRPMGSGLVTGTARPIHVGRDLPCVGDSPDRRTGAAGLHFPPDGVGDSGTPRPSRWADGPRIERPQPR